MAKLTSPSTHDRRRGVGMKHVEAQDQHELALVSGILTGCLRLGSIRSDHSFKLGVCAQLDESGDVDREPLPGRN